MQIQGLLMLLLIAIPVLPTGKLSPLPAHVAWYATLLPSNFTGVILQHRSVVREPALVLGGPGLPLAAVCGHFRGAAVPLVHRLQSQVRWFFPSGHPRVLLWLLGRSLAESQRLVCSHFAACKDCGHCQDLSTPKKPIRASSYSYGIPCSVAVELLVLRRL